MTGDVRLSVRALGRVVCRACNGSLLAPVALAADCPRPDALGTSRTLVVDAKAHPLIGTHAVSRDAAAQRRRSGADLRRRAAAEEQQPDSRDPRCAMRQGDLLHGRPPGAGQSGRRAQGARRRPHGGDPQPEPSLQHAPPLGRARQGRDRRRHCQCHRGARRRRRGRHVAVFPHPGSRPQ